MKYFTKDEFVTYSKTGEKQNWLGLYDRWVLSSLDTFRGLWGFPVHISKANGAQGRYLTEDHASYNSRHNFNKWGYIKAIDVFPERLVTKKDVLRAERIAMLSGFAGVGVYLDTFNQGTRWIMLHLDARKETARWGRVEGKYVGWDYVIKYWNKPDLVSRSGWR